MPLTRPKNDIQGPLDIVTACYLPLTGQTQHCRSWTRQQAYCSQDIPYHHAAPPVSMFKKEECEESFKKNVSHQVNSSDSLSTDKGF